MPIGTFRLWRTQWVSAADRDPTYRTSCLVDPGSPCSERPVGTVGLEPEPADLVDVGGVADGSDSVNLQTVLNNAQGRIAFRRLSNAAFVAQIERWIAELDAAGD